MIERVLLGLVLALAIFVAFANLPRGRPVREWVLRRLPGIARVYWSSVLARFSHTSALGAFSGLPLPDLIVNGGASSGSLALAATTRRVADKLNRGDSIEEAARGERDLPALWVFTVSVAGRRGDLPGALEELARAYEVRAQQCVGALRIILGPVLLVLLGILLGSAIVGMLLPMIQVINNLSGG